MINKWFRPKQRVELHMDTSDGVLNLPTHIEHVTEAGEFIVAAPFYKGRLYPFLAREKVGLFTIVQGVGIVSCDTIVERKLKSGEIALVLLERISEVRKTQRRKHYRLPTLLQADLEIDERPELHQIHAVSKDISAGGMRLITQRELYKQEHVKLKVDLNGITLNLHSQVLETVVLKDHQRRYESRLSFDVLPIDEERTIVAYIFDEQRKRRGK